MKKIALVAGVVLLALALGGLVAPIDAVWLGAALGGIAAVQPVRDGASIPRTQFINNGVAAGVTVLAVVFGVALHKWPKPSQTRTSLQALQTRLDSADRLGDFVAAQAMYRDITAELRQLNDTAGRRSCQLAAMHLAGAIDEVARGGRWLDRSRFEAALDECA